MIRVAEDLADLAILIVDDEPANLRLLERVLRRAGFRNVTTTTTPGDVVSIAGTVLPDIILLDLHMPELSGVEVLEQLRGEDIELAPLVVVLTGDDSREARAQALSAGARDFITKPFDTHEIALRIRNFAELRRLHKRLQQSNANLEFKVWERTAELEEARLDVLDRLAKAAEFRDDNTGQHTRRVGTIAGRIARILSLDAKQVELIERAAPLHDVGKIGIPDAILLKPGPLDKTEMTVMRTHTTIGANLLSSSRSSLLKIASDIAISHHERWDGTGYPQGLGGDEIPLAGDVLELMESERGKHFDPPVIDAFMESVRADPGNFHAHHGD
jgi:putative two-component system response regulator